MVIFNLKFKTALLGSNLSLMMPIAVEENETLGIRGKTQKPIFTEIMCSVYTKNNSVKIRKTSGTTFG